MSSQKRLNSLKIVMPAIFASMAVFMTIANMVFPFPILPYLRFELAEIPVVTLFYLMGPVQGLSSAAIYWGVLNIVGEWIPIGPAMKFLSLAPTILGLFIGIKMYEKRVKRSANKIIFYCLPILFAIIFRVAVTSLMNYVLLGYLFPYFLDFAMGSLASSLGLNIAERSLGLIFTLIFTGIFNVIHTFITIVPSLTVVNSIVKMRLAGLNVWLNKVYSEN